MLGNFTTFDIQMFIWRAIVFLFTVALLIVADVIISKRRLLLDNGQLDSGSVSAKIRLFIAILLYLAGAAIGVLAIYELISNNPNEWLVIKISFYVICWLATVLLPIFSGDERGALVFLCIVVFSIISIGSAIIGGEASSASRETSEEVLDSRTLVAVNDGTQKTGKAGSIIFFTTFAISEDGIYRYYWQDESGGIRQDSVDSDITIVYYTKSGEQPHLDKMTHVSHTFGTRNKRQYENIVDNGYSDVWYELYIPEGSIADSYSLDLQ